MQLAADIDRARCSKQVSIKPDLELLLSTNAPPSLSESVYVQRAKGKAEAKLRLLEEAAAKYGLDYDADHWPVRIYCPRVGTGADATPAHKRPFVSLRNMPDQIAACKARINSCQRILSPVRRLPPEVLMGIFTHLDPAELAVSARGAATGGPVALAQLCRGWRAIVRGTPELWAAATFHFADAANPSPAMVANIVHSWFACAGDCALTAHLVSPSTQLVDFLRACSGRCRHLELSVDKSFPAGFPEAKDVVMAALESLTVRKTNEADEWISMHISFMVAPRLRSVSYSTFIVPSHISLPWSQLTEIVCDGVMSDQERNWMFEECRNLVSCTLAAPFYFSLSSPAPQVVHTLPSLCHLKIIIWSIYTVKDLGLFLSTLCLPSLESLELVHNSTDAYVTQNNWSHESLLDFLASAKDKLRHLTLHKIPIPVIPLLEHLPQLTSLDLLWGMHDPCIARTLVLALAAPGDKPLLPRLENISITAECRPACKVCQDELIDVAVARGLPSENAANPTRAGVRLRTFRFMSTAYCDLPGRKVLLERLQTCRRQGLDIQLGEA